MLDVGTGVGEPAITAARRTAPGGTVVAVDASAAMLDAARRRAAALGVDSVDFVLGDAAELSIDGPFDALVAACSLMFLPDPGGNLRRLSGLLAPRAVVAAAQQRGPDASPAAFGLPVRVASEVLGRDGPAGSGLSELADPAVATALFGAAGLTDVRTALVASTYRWTDAQQYRHVLAETCQPLRAALDGGTRQETERVWRAIGSAVAHFADAEGRLAVPHEALVVWGVRPPADAQPVPPDDLLLRRRRACAGGRRRGRRARGRRC